MMMILTATQEMNELQSSESSSYGAVFNMVIVYRSITRTAIKSCTELPGATTHMAPVISIL